MCIRDRPYPLPLAEAQDLPGLHPEDVDGDGRILTMRIRDDRKGEWAISSQDSRLLVPRRPGQRRGPFYRLFTEGMLHKDVYKRQPLLLAHNMRSQFRP